MTPLPALPANLDPACISCGAISSLTAGVQGAAAGAIGGAIAGAQGAIAGQTAQLQALVAQANAANAATIAIIDAFLSDDIINQLLEKFKIPPYGIPDIQCVKDELLKIHDQVNDANELIIKVLQGPPIDIGAAIKALIPDIPVPVIPSPGEIKERIMFKLNEKRKEQQQAIMKLQRQKAEAIAKAQTFV